MIELIAENQQGTRLNLTRNNDYRTTCTGLDPANAVINRSTVGTSDGSVINSARVEDKNIVLTAVLQNNVEAARLAIYDIFRLKQSVRLYLSTGERDVYIDGRVENVEIDHFSNPQAAQISLICPFPFFRNVTEKVFESLSIKGMFEFPFSISADGVPFSEFSQVIFVTLFNDGEVPGGMVVEFEAQGVVVNPIVYSVETHGAIGIMTTLNKGDRVLVDTTQGQKSVTGIIDGQRLNFIRYLNRSPEWFQLTHDENYYTIDAESGLENLNVIFRHNDIYEGV
ncbi:phage tail family protein [Clostridiales Family XIII bacterium ASD5510]|uniref:Phage tail family protein n=2 Tax=Bacteria TaxID=2 RepID=A0A9J6QV25_9FIRM|nr:phage tail domain-containing protein [Hominibacterium faecale]MCU7379708.1 phage tail family protein [Hominibacterium faecale]